MLVSKTIKHESDERAPTGLKLELTGPLEYSFEPNLFLVHISTDSQSCRSPSRVTTCDFRLIIAFSIQTSNNCTSATHTLTLKYSYNNHAHSIQNKLNQNFILLHELIFLFTLTRSVSKWTRCNPMISKQSILKRIFQILYSVYLLSRMQEKCTLIS